MRAAANVRVSFAPRHPEVLPCPALSRDQQCARARARAAGPGAGWSLYWAGLRWCGGRSRSPRPGTRCSCKATACSGATLRSPRSWNTCRFPAAPPPRRAAAPLGRGGRLNDAARPGAVIVCIPPPPSRTNWTRLVPLSVLTGHEICAQVDALGRCLKNGEYPSGVGTVEAMARYKFLIAFENSRRVPRRAPRLSGAVPRRWLLSALSISSFLTILIRFPGPFYPSSGPFSNRPSR